VCHIALLHKAYITKHVTRDEHIRYGLRWQEQSFTKEARTLAKNTNLDELKQQDFLTVAESARFTRSSEATIRRKLTSGELHRYKFFGRTLVKKAELLGLIREA